jgi:hypothetical protein
MSDAVTMAQLGPWNDPVDLIRAITRTGDTRDEATRNRVAELLSHADADVREAALRRVARWRDTHYQQQIIDLLRFDQADAVRSAAAYGVVSLSSSATRAADTSALLGRLLDDVEDPEVRASAYDALLIMYGRRPPEPSEREFDAQNDIDWEWIATLRQGPEAT